MKIFLGNHNFKNPVKEGRTPFFETDKEVEWDSVLEINGKFYRPISQSNEYEKPGYEYTCVEELREYNTDKVDIEEGEWRASNEDTLICPVCGYEHEPSVLYESDSEFECWGCGSILDVDVECTIKYIPKVKEITKVQKL